MKWEKWSSHCGTDNHVQDTGAFPLLLAFRGRDPFPSIPTGGRVQVHREALAAIGELLGAAGVIASLLCLAVEVRQNTRQTRLAAQQATVQELEVALRAQAQDREWAKLLSRGPDDIESLDKVERVQFLSHVGSILRLNESAYLHQPARQQRRLQPSSLGIVSPPGRRAAYPWGDSGSAPPRWIPGVEP